MSKFANMGKVELRTACKAAGVKGYGNMTNDGMRAALEAAAPVAAPAVQTNIPAPTAIEKGAASELKVRKAPKKATERKVRAAANGVTQPSSGTICGAIWAALDAKRTALKGETPTFEHLRELAKDAGWQKNTAMTQYQRWKQFNGLMPRSLTV